MDALNNFARDMGEVARSMVQAFSTTAQTDREVLATLYKATDGRKWGKSRSWETDAPLSQWYGIKTNDQGRVVSIDLDDNNLQGSIPKELGSLSELRELFLNKNRLTGSIPKELGALSELRYLFLVHNRLTGSIPKELGALSELQDLYLSNNQLTGPIPEELGDLKALKRLYVCFNMLSGTLPKRMGELNALESLDLQSNNLTGFWDFSGGVGHAEDLLQGRASEPTRFKVWPVMNSIPSSSPMDPSCCHEVASYEYLPQDVISAPKQLGKLLEKLSWVEASRRTFDFNDEDVIKGDHNLYPRPRPREFRIDGNPWEEPPEAVVVTGMRAVSEYFADLLASDATVRRCMIKVVLVGQEGAGKTSLRQSIRARHATPTSGSQESTVQIDVEEIKMDFDGVSLRVYDCAGQVAYTGLLQMFLTPRAVSLLVCDTGKFWQRNDCSSNMDQQLNQDFVKLQELRVCDWLRSLSFRVTNSDVVIVATKCDLACGMAVDLAGRIERAVQKWLRSWSAAGMTAVRVESGVSLTSCFPSAQEERKSATVGEREGRDGLAWECDWREGMHRESPPSLLHRVVYDSKGDLRGTMMVLPRSWDIALEMLDALGSGRDPVESVQQKVLLVDGSLGGKGVSATAQQHERMTSLRVGELFARWSEVIESLEENGVEVINATHAMEGALLIREHEGSLVRHETYIFLDVAWLAQILKPLLNHKDSEDPSCGSISLGDTGITLDDDKHKACWKWFKKTGILESALAKVLWPDGLADYVLPTLDGLGLAHPLDGETADRRVVLLRLDEDRPEDVGKELNKFRHEHDAVLSVTWKIFLGVPPGAIEKVLTRCCSIGTVRTFWRFGVLIQGGFRELTSSRNFALLVEYSHKRTEIDMRVYGDIGTAAPWAALSVGISSVLNMCSEFLGLRWRASFKCPEHEQDIEISKSAIEPGDRLLHGEVCSLCSFETGGVGAAARSILKKVNVLQTRDEIFQEVNARILKQRPNYPALDPEPRSETWLTKKYQRRFKAWQSGMKQEVEDLLHLAAAPTGRAAIEDTSPATEREVAKLQLLVGDVQRQLAQNHMDVRGWIAVVDKRLEGIIDADAGAMDTRDYLVAMLRAVRRDGFDTPRYACVLPPWPFHEAHGLSEKEQAPETWIKRLKQWQDHHCVDGKGFFKKQKRLFLVCAHTHRLVPCGPDGQGYDITQPRTWFRKSLSAATFALQITLSTLTAMVAIPLPGAGPAVEAAVSAAMGGVEEILQSQLEELTGDNGSDGVGIGSQAAQLGESGYASLREFIHGIEDTARLRIAKSAKTNEKSSTRRGSSEFVFFSQKMAQVQRRKGDAAVQWVLKGQEETWHNAMASAPIEYESL